MITTLTLNPAFDLHVSLDAFHAERENLADTVLRHIGGKGINLSRALAENGVCNRAVVVVGEENGAEFCGQLEKVPFSCTFLPVPGRIRENVTIHPRAGRETRLSFGGLTCDESLLERVKAALHLEAGDILTFTGSLPWGITAEGTRRFLRTLQAEGVSLVIDSKSVPLSMLTALRPMLIKPNQEEMEAYIGSAAPSDMVRGAEALHQSGICFAMVSLGEAGAILACEAGTFLARPPKIHALSTIGAGDSALAGFLTAWEAGKSAPECLREAVAYGTAACLQAGTLPPAPQAVAALRTQIALERIG